MSLENSFTVTRFENRNGVTSWRIAGWLHGVRIRKNFKSKEEAAFRRIGTGSRNLTTLIDYALTHYREADKPRPLADCINTYLAAKHRDQVRDILSLRQYRSNHSPASRGAHASRRNFR